MIPLQQEKPVSKVQDDREATQQKDVIIQMLGQEVALLKLKIMKLEGGGN